MNELLVATVPRHLRVRSSVQIAGTRLPARGFLLGLGIVFGSAVAVTLGADLERTIWICGALIAGGLAVVEGRVWGRSSSEALMIVLRFVRRRQRLRLERPIITLAADSDPVTLTRRPRWNHADS